MSSELVDWRDVDRGVDALQAVCDQVLRAMTSHEKEPQLNSKGFKEKQSAEQASVEFLDYAFKHGGHVLMASADFGHALCRTLDPSRMQPFAPWGCARHILEMTSMCVWLLDPNLCLTTRMARGAIAELEDLNHFRRYAKESKQDDLVSKTDTDKKELHQRTEDIRIADIIKAEKVSTSKRIDLLFGNSWIYPMLSQLAHGNRTMSLALGLPFMRVGIPHPDSYRSACVGQWLVGSSMIWILKSLRTRYQLFGWDTTELEPASAAADNALSHFKWPVSALICPQKRPRGAGNPLF